MLWNTTMADYTANIQELLFRKKTFFAHTGVMNCTTSRDIVSNAASRSHTLHGGVSGLMV